MAVAITWLSAHMVFEFSYRNKSELHRDRKKTAPKQNAVKCTIYNTI